MDDGFFAGSGLGAAAHDLNGPLRERGERDCDGQKHDAGDDCRKDSLERFHIIVSFAYNTNDILSNNLSVVKKY